MTQDDLGASWTLCREYGGARNRQRPRPGARAPIRTCIHFAPGSALRSRKVFNFHIEIGQPSSDRGLEAREILNVQAVNLCAVKDENDDIADREGERRQHGRGTRLRSGQRMAGTVWELGSRFSWRILTTNVSSLRNAEAGDRLFSPRWQFPSWPRKTSVEVVEAIK